MDIHYVGRAVKAHRSTQVDAPLHFEQTVDISTDGDVVDADLIPMMQTIQKSFRVSRCCTVDQAEDPED